MTTYIPWVALIISVISLIVSIYKIYRDKSELVTWSEIVYHQSLKDGKSYPVMYLYAVNKGLRPITLTDIGFEVSNYENVLTRIKPMEDIALDISDIDFESKIPQQLSQDIGVRLEDGDIYEIRIQYDEYYKFLSAYHNFEVAKKMFFKDVLGTHYYVKNSNKHINILDNYK
ncbi:MAG: hypothetical protein PHX13_00745 [Thiovulaceae bacterium]|nr:hypothetical protein [Sulfurimonadaceae bacterium]